MQASATPRVVLSYGLLGLIPFLAPPLLGLWVPVHAGMFAVVALAYGALILSFLGGARWGLAVARPDPGFGVITLSMLPTLLALALLLLPGIAPARQLIALATLLTLHFVWDAGSKGLPAWYPRLRGLLTLGAVAGLLAMAWVMTRTAAPDAMTI
ncbi:MAG: hypothetical protein RL490_1091 [Pseudomonadota bacterium]|jgi:hypothetical protein